MSMEYIGGSPLEVGKQGGDHERKNYCSRFPNE